MEPTSGTGPAGRVADGPARILELLAAVGDVELRAELVAGVVGVDDARSTLEWLRSRHLVDGDGASYRLAGGSAPEPPAAAARDAWLGRVLDYLVAQYRDGDHAASVEDDLEIVDATLSWAAEHQRWADTVRLAQAVDAPLALSRRWGTWETVLRRALEAARAAGDEVGEAWAHHQLGTRAAGIGDLPEACRHLSLALEFRERLGDDRGAEVSSHNLTVCRAAAGIG